MPLPRPQTPRSRPPFGWMHRAPRLKGCEPARNPDSSKAGTGIHERQVRRLLRKLRRKGDQAVIHELRGRESNRKLSSEVEQQAITVLSAPVYRGFGPTLASEYLHKLHQITVSKETLRHWMAKAGLWRAGQVRVVEVHQS